MRGPRYGGERSRRHNDKHKPRRDFAEPASLQDPLQ